MPAPGPVPRTLCGHVSCCAAHCSVLFKQQTTSLSDAPPPASRRLSRSPSALERTLFKTLKRLMFKTLSKTLQGLRIQVCFRCLDRDAVDTMIEELFSEHVYVLFHFICAHKFSDTKFRPLNAVTKAYDLCHFMYCIQA